jgi:hypothetical protein
MSDSPLVPEWEKLGIPVEDTEPEDAGVEHLASVEEVDSAAEGDDG